MSENAQNQDRTPEPNTEPKKRTSKLVIITLIIIAIVIVSLLVYSNLNGELHAEQNKTQHWYFKGAYANYEGTTSYLFFNVNFLMRFEIVDFNNTHVKTLYDMKLQAGTLGTLFNEQDTIWAPAENLGTFAWEQMEGYKQKAEYQDRVYIEGLGIKLCKIYEFTHIENESGDMNITVYADPEIDWPLKIEFDMNLDNNQNINLDITMKDTNIPKLMR